MDSWRVHFGFQGVPMGFVGFWGFGLWALDQIGQPLASSYHTHFIHPLSQGHTVIHSAKYAAWIGRKAI